MYFLDEKAMQEINGTFFDKAPASFDPIMGYRWNPRPIRIVRIIHNELIMDHYFGGNNYGYSCEYDFSPRKSSPRTFRFICFGDSYTNGIHMHCPWPQQLQLLLRSRQERGRDIEVYPCPIDGGGLPNWHSVLMNQTLPEFELDALIIGQWVENLFRDFVICLNHEKTIHFVTPEYSERPRTRREYEQHSQQIPVENIGYEIMDAEQLDRIVREIARRQRPAPVTPEFYYSEWDEWESGMAPREYAFTPEAFIERYSEERWRLLSEIMSACAERNIPIIYCSMPTRQGALRKHSEPGRLLHQAETEGIARHFGIYYFDGYDIFAGASEQAITDYYWLKYDAHWDEPASNLFALKLAEWITDHGIVPS